MAKQLVRMLRVDERRFRAYIDRLEHVTLHPSIDIKLALEIRFASKEKLKVLELDPENIDAETVYGALKQKLRSDEQALIDAFKLSKSSAHLRAHKLAILASKLSRKDKTLSVTPAGCKRILSAVPPKRTMRLLKLRSLESVTKREDPRVLYATACMVEDESWRSQVHAKMKRMPSKDFSWQSPEALVMPKGWYEKVKDHASGHGLIVRCPEIGMVMVLPLLDSTSPGILTYALGTMLQSLQLFSAESMPYLKDGLTRGFHEAIPLISQGKTSQLEPVHGMTPSWLVIYELYTKGHFSDALSDASLFLDDIEWQSLEMKLASIVAQFSFWVDTHYLGYNEADGVVSFHILDVARNVIVDAPIAKQSTAHLETTLWNELNLRYLKQDSLTEKIVSQLRVEESFVV